MVKCLCYLMQTYVFVCFVWIYTEFSFLFTMCINSMQGSVAVFLIVYILVIKRYNELLKILYKYFQNYIYNIC